MRLTIITTVAVFAALTLSTSASAQDVNACAEDQVASGPYCVNPIYVNNPLFVDPATCEWGYFQGSCTPEPAAPVDLGQEAYTFQTPDPAIASNPAPVHTTIGAPVVTDWLTSAELQSFDLRHGPR